jgi:hypothetical protein
MQQALDLVDHERVPFGLPPYPILIDSRHFLNNRYAKFMPSADSSLSTIAAGIMPQYTPL